MKKGSKKLGFTNRMSLALIGLLIAGTIMSFYLALRSIEGQYLGSLACWTVCFSPLSVGIDVVLNAIVNKSKAENLGPKGEGVRYSQIIKEGDTDI